MKRPLQIVLVLAASIGCFVIYCIMWIDWVQDFTSGVYTRNYLEALVETIALASYTYLAIHFAYSRLNMF